MQFSQKQVNLTLYSSKLNTPNMSLKLLPIALFISFVTTIWQQSHAELVWIEKANFGGEARHRGVGFSVGGRGYMGLGHYNSIVDITNI